MAAVSVRLTVTVVAEPPEVSVPPAAETFNHAEVLDRLQLMASVPALVRVKVVELVENGPPTPPMAVKPVAGVTTSGMV